MTIVLPVEATPYFTGTSTFGASPWVDTRDSDSSYVVIQPTGVGGSVWRLRLPAVTVCSDATSVSVLVEARYVPGTGDYPSPTWDLTPTVSLQRWTGSLFGFLTSPAFFADDPSSTYVLEDAAQTPQSFFGYTVQTVLDELAAGNLYITLFQQYDGNTAYETRVTYAALNVNCPRTPPLRQNQRDDARQNQRTSQQLTVRQRGYL